MTSIRPMKRSNERNDHERHTHPRQGEARVRARARGRRREGLRGIAEAGPAGVHYSSARLADGVTFVALLALEDEDAENPLASVPAFVEFQQGLARWLDGPPEVDRMAVLGSYRVF
jgi:hypothetical protein